MRSEVKTLIVKARRALAGGANAAEDRIESTVDAVRALDRASAKRILHPNNAARRKSRLARRLAKLAAAAPAPASSGKGKKPAAAAPANTKKR